MATATDPEMRYICWQHGERFGDICAECGKVYPGMPFREAVSRGLYKKPHRLWGESVDLYRPKVKTPAG